MAGVELFFSGLGWCLFGLGLISCLIPRCFKTAVVIMLAGDLALMLGILFPRMFMDLSFFSAGEISAHFHRLAGIAAAVALYALIMYPRYRALRRRKGATETPAESQTGNAAVSPDGSRAAAALFANVKKSAASQAPKTHQGLFGGMDPQDRR